MMKGDGYKETEIGHIPVEWDVARLGNYCKVQNGYPFESAGFNESDGIPLIRVRSLKVQSCDIYYRGSFDERYLVNDGDVLIGMDGDFQPCWWKGGKAVLNQRVCRLIDLDSGVEPFYIYQALKRPLKQIEDATGYTTVKHVSSFKVQDIRIPLPPLPEQKKIAAILSKIQQAIEVQEKIIESTKELKSALMAKLFMEGLYGEELKETEIGLIPKSWKVTSVGDVATFQGGYAFKSADYSKSGVRLFKIANVSFGKCLWDDVSFLPLEYLNEHAEYCLNPGDLVLAMTRPIVSGGIKVARLTESDCPAFLNQRVGRFQVKSEVEIEFLFQLVLDRRFTAAISDGAGGSQQPNISSKQIERIRIPLPPIDEQRDLSGVLCLLDTKIKNAESKTLQLRSLFKSMLHQLMTGQMRVNNIEFQGNME
ncbi:MAG: restriction endonuclease subunit S [bacterium]